MFSDIYKLTKFLRFFKLNWQNSYVKFSLIYLNKKYFLKLLSIFDFVYIYILVYFYLFKKNISFFRSTYKLNNVNTKIINSNLIGISDFIKKVKLWLLPILLAIFIITFFSYIRSISINRVLFA